MTAVWNFCSEGAAAGTNKKARRTVKLHFRMALPCSLCRAEMNRTGIDGLVDGWANFDGTFVKI